ncbi:MAG: hypothetical protein HWQ38_36260 [Nostoc sp. NMS7]|uniref:hypothetical protein n=1 Tax=Nostoc sp. NMS7 TaxID=2815391 RepID=UPI0025F0D427|nr:hypothetical protein [Nostoc sp. NMS7]MBN3951626.1 hypothetical protein [Nostoc sp. NMS7]
MGVVYLSGGIALYPLRMRSDRYKSKIQYFYALTVCSRYFPIPGTGSKVGSFDSAIAPHV